MKVKLEIVIEVDMPYRDFLPATEHLLLGEIKDKIWELGYKPVSVTTKEFSVTTKRQIK